LISEARKKQSQKDFGGIFQWKLITSSLSSELNVARQCWMERATLAVMFLPSAQHSAILAQLHTVGPSETNNKAIFFQLLSSLFFEKKFAEETR
jgi:hypothetical protein